MAKKTLADIQAQIEELQRQADEIAQAEKAEVIAELRVQIEAHGLTKDDLFGKAKPHKAQARRVPTVRERRTFTDAEKEKMVERHWKLVTGGQLFRDAAEKIGVQQSVLRRWYSVLGKEIPARQAA